MSSEDTHFARLVSLACHDLRTPLATIYGFSRTLTRRDDLGEPAGAYVAMIEASAQQLGDLIDLLTLAARIEGGRYDPARREVDTRDLALAAQERLGEERVKVHGPGGPVLVDADATPRAISALAQCALRHGGLESVTVMADGPVLHIDPITPASAPVVLGEDLRDLGAAVANTLLVATGGSVALHEQTLVVRLEP
jgi:signal transduction histidine kinase